MVKRILLPTDFSDNAQNALNYAIDLVKKSKGKLFLLHVYELPTFATDSIDPTHLAEEPINYVRLKAHDKLKQIINRYRLSNIKHRALLREGNVKTEILNAIENFDIDLVVMGPGGTTAEKGLFTESITKSIIQDTARPVFAIPKEANFNEIRKIVYLSNLNYDETPFLNYIIDFAKIYNACIVVLHFEHNNESMATYNNNQAVLKDLVNHLDYNKLTYKEMVVKNLNDGIKKYVKDDETVIIAMTTYTTSIFDKLFHKSLTKHILLHTQIPLLAFNGNETNGFEKIRSNQNH